MTGSDAADGGWGPPPDEQDRSAAADVHHPAAARRRDASPGLALRHELARKALHLTSAAVPLAYAAGMPRSPLLGGLAVLVLTALLVEMTRRRVALVRSTFVRVTRPLLRAHEHEGLSGATWMLVAFALAVWLLPRDVAIAATWAVAVGDASAAIVGRAFGRIRVGAHGKSLEGSLACLVATALGAALVARLGPGASIAAGVAAAAAELPGRPLDDNLRVAAAVPLAVTAVQLVLPRV